MSAWAPYRTALGGGDPATTTGSETCSRCRGSFPSSDLIALGGGRICAACKPIVLQGLREGVSATEMLSDGLWRDGKTLVMNREAALPARCVKCGEPVAALSLKRKLTWHSPWWYVLVLVNLLIYALVAVIISKRATIQVGLCDRHRGRRKLLMISAWLLVAAAIVMFFLAAGVNANSGLWVALGVLGLLVAGILGVIASRVVLPKRITKERIWLTGIHPSILETLPEWDGGKE
jgi:hypothetical protein